MPTQTLSPEILVAAIEGFESRKTRIDLQIAELRAMLAGSPSASVPTPEAPTGKRKISAAARRRMALGQKARWAKLKGTSEVPAPVTPEPSKPKRKLSEAGKAAIVAATKARWDRVRAAVAKPKAVARKTAAVKTVVVKKASVKAAKKGVPAKKSAVKKPAANKRAPGAAKVGTKTAAQ